MKTAVEWYAKQLARIGVTDELIGHLTKEAKQMEKEQSEKYAEFSVLSDRRGLPLLDWESYLKPFNETYKNTNDEMD